MRKENSIVPYIILSLIVHASVFFMFFYKDNKKVFVQVPFEVSFYSPVTNVSVDKFTDINKTKKKKVKENKEKVKKNKSDIINKKEIKKNEPKETVSEEQEPVDENLSSSSSKGIMLENKNFKYSYYTNTIVKKISKYWQWSRSISALRAVIYFKIARDGTVYSIKVKNSSGDEGFDQNAMRAIELASPFAPLPTSYEEDNLGVYFEFKFR